jgi:hypothetical protein
VSECRLSASSRPLVRQTLCDRPPLRRESRGILRPANVREHVRPERSGRDADAFVDFDILHRGERDVGRLRRTAEAPGKPRLHERELRLPRRICDNPARRVDNRGRLCPPREPTPEQARTTLRHHRSLRIARGFRLECSENQLRFLRTTLRRHRPGAYVPCAQTAACLLGSTREPLGQRRRERELCLARRANEHVGASRPPLSSRQPARRSKSPRRRAPLSSTASAKRRRTTIVRVAVAPDWTASL